MGDENWSHGVLGFRIADYSNIPVFDRSGTPTMHSLRQGADLGVCAAQATGEFPRDIENQFPFNVWMTPSQCLKVGDR
jgi:hypothetical protein